MLEQNIKELLQVKKLLSATKAKKKKKDSASPSTSRAAIITEKVAQKFLCLSLSVKTLPLPPNYVVRKHLPATHSRYNWMAAAVFFHVMDELLISCHSAIVPLGCPRTRSQDSTTVVATNHSFG
jgi:hypothetical protein